MVTEAVKKRLREQYRTLDPVALLAEIRAAQEELGNRIDRRTGGALRENAGGKSDMVVHSSTAEPAAFARGLGNDLARGEPRATHRRSKRRYKKRVRMPSKLDPHVALIESWVAAEPQLTAIAIVGRPRQPPSRPVRQQAAFDRAASAASLAQECRAEINHRGLRRRMGGDPHQPSPCCRSRNGPG